MRLILSALLFFSLLACSAPVPPPEPSSPLMLRQELAALPGAQVPPREPLTVRYPGAALFVPAAALPTAGGMAVLEPLASWLQAHPETAWRAVVRARTDVGADYDRRLAAKRGELLQRYFRNLGIAEAQLSFLAEAGEDGAAPFELIRQDGSASKRESSAGEKE